MKRISWILTAMIALAAAGCDNGAAISPDQESLTRRLRTPKDSYYEYEPLDLILVSVNSTPQPRNLGLQDQGGFLIIHELADNDEVSWRPIPIQQDVTGMKVAPGEAVDLRLSDPTGRAVLDHPGTWVVIYRYFRQTGASQQFQFAAPDLLLQCTPQPLTIPAGTPADVADALKSLAAATAHQYASIYPNWTKAVYSAPMYRLRDMGDRAVPALLANLGHYRIRPAVIQVLADIRCRAAVPLLLQMLRMDDGTQDQLILSALAAITDIPTGREFYMNWERPETKEDALAAYRAWCEKNR